MDYLRQMQADDDWRAEALRGLGALLFGIGALVLIVRRSSLGDPWADFPLLVAWLVPAVLLYGVGLAAARAAGPRTWHSIWVVFGILFVYGTLLQFLEVVEGDTGAPLNTVWTLCVVAAVAALAAVFARVRFGWLIAGVALAIAWLALWDEILEDGISSDAGTFRGLCMIAALLLVAGAWFLERRRGSRDTVAEPGDDFAESRRNVSEPRREAAELVTAAGLVFLLGAGLVSFTGAFGGLSGVPTAGVPSGGGFAEPSLFWDLVLLGGSVALVGVGSLVLSRGPVYVGATGILLFVSLVGLDLDDDSPAGKIIGWPLILLVLALLAIAASVFARRHGDSRDPQAPPPPETTASPAPPSSSPEP